MRVELQNTPNMSSEQGQEQEPEPAPVVLDAPSVSVRSWIQWVRLVLCDHLRHTPIYHGGYPYLSLTLHLSTERSLIILLSLT